MLRKPRRGSGAPAPAVSLPRNERIEPDKVLAVLHLSLARQSGAADDIVPAECSGRGQVAVSISQLAELAAALDGNRLRLELAAAERPIRITDPDDARLLLVLMPMRWA